VTRRCHRELARPPFTFRQKSRKRMHENYVALSVRISYHRIMTFWQTAKLGEYMKPCSRRELALSTRTVAFLRH
jgi:hypothetical protein